MERPRLGTSDERGRPITVAEAVRASSKYFARAAPAAATCSSSTRWVAIFTRSPMPIPAPGRNLFGLSDPRITGAARLVLQEA